MSRRLTISLSTVLVLLSLLGALVGGAGARTVYVAARGNGGQRAGLAAIDSKTNRKLDVPSANNQIVAGANVEGVAITPDGRFAYVAGGFGLGGSGVAVIDTATNKPIEFPDETKVIGAGSTPAAVAITHDGRFAYVANRGGGVSVIDTAAHKTIDVPDGNKLITAGAAPCALAITPDDRFVYVANCNGGVSVIDTAANRAIEVPDGAKQIKVGIAPRAVAITPDGRFAYVASLAGVSVIDTATNQAIEVPDGNKLIKVGGQAVKGIAISPNGRFAYVACEAGGPGNLGGVSVIDTATNQAIEVPDGNKLIGTGNGPLGIAFTPNGRFAYVADFVSGTGVSVIDTATNQAIEVPDGGKLIRTNNGPFAIAVTPSGGFAYVAGSRGVSVIATSSNRAIEVPDSDNLIRAGAAPNAVAITPDGRFAYVADEGLGGQPGGVAVVDTATNRTIEVPDGGKLIKAGPRPIAAAVSPDGRFVYVADFGDATSSGGVSVIDTATNQAIEVPDGGKLIKVAGLNPGGIAITPDGRFAYVTCRTGGVAVIDTATNQAVEVPDGGKLIKVGQNPFGIAITPDGRFAYVADEGVALTEVGAGVSVIDTTINQAIEVPDGERRIKAGRIPRAVAITQDGRFAYVTDAGSNAVSVIDTTTNQPIEVPDGNKLIKVMFNPSGIAIAPGGGPAYVSAFNVDAVSVLDTAANQAIEVPDGERRIRVRSAPFGVAVSPDQPPAASFSTPRARPGVPVTLDASASKDPDSAIASYAWTFEDGSERSSAAPTAVHTFPFAGTYEVTLKETDVEGCSTPDTFTFTGQTASCAGNPGARITKSVVVAYPGVRVRCPKSAGRRGCAFKLQVVARKPRKGRRPTFESALARAKLKPRHSAIVTLKPRRRFAHRLAVAHRVLVKETARIKGSTRTRYVRLRIVQ